MPVESRAAGYQKHWHYRGVQHKQRCLRMADYDRQNIFLLSGTPPGAHFAQRLLGLEPLPRGHTISFTGTGVSSSLVGNNPKRLFLKLNRQRTTFQTVTIWASSGKNWDAHHVPDRHFRGVQLVERLLGLDALPGGPQVQPQRAHLQLILGVQQHALGQAQGARAQPQLLVRLKSLQVRLGAAQQPLARRRCATLV